MKSLNSYIQEALIKKDTKLGEAKPKPPKQRKSRVITKEITYYACYLDKVNKTLHCYSLGDFTKSSEGRKDAMKEAVYRGHPFTVSRGKYKGVLHRDQIRNLPLPNDYSNTWY